MKLFLVLAFILALAATADAQQPAPPVPNREIIEALQAQRNWALDMHAQASAQITKLQAEIEDLKAKLKAAEKKE